MNGLWQRFPSLVFILLLTACNADAISFVPQNDGAPSIRSAATKQYLYVVNAGSGYVNIYAAGSATFERRINLHAQSQGPLLFDSKGYLYLENDGIIDIFAPGASLPTRTVSSNTYYYGDLALDKNNNLYAQQSPKTAQCEPKNSVVELKAGTSIMRTISKGTSNARTVALDTSGNVYVANDPCSGGPNSVSVYNPGASTPRYTISKGIASPGTLAIDSRGTLYVANQGTGTVTEYPSGTSTPSATISIAGAVALTLDTKNDLYVANGGAVTVYAPGKTMPAQTITKGFTQSCGAGPMALDSEANLYVATGLNNIKCPVLAYRHDTNAPFLSITADVSGPSALAIGAHP